MRQQLLQGQGLGRLRDCRGQIAVIMIVAIAIGLILFAASINYSLIAQNKTLTLKAASASASATSSMLASYAQKQFVETLGSQIEKCKTSGGFSLLGFIFLVVVAVFAPEIAGFLSPAGTAQVAINALADKILTAAVVGATMELASVIIASSIDPGISDAWNKMQNANLSMTGQFVERGIQTALQQAVTDHVQIPDLYDLDHDGLFGYREGADPKVDPPLDTVSRFAFYNTKRFLDLPTVESDEVEAFLKALHELVLQGDDRWGLWDPVLYPDWQTCAASGHVCCSENPPAECDICCQNLPPEELPPVCAARGGSCPSRTPFRAAGQEYPLIYDPTYENSLNTFMSFREQLGRDDEHHLYQVNYDDVTNVGLVNWHSVPGTDAQVLRGNGFFLKDVVGHYVPPGYSSLDEWVRAETAPGEVPPLPPPSSITPLPLPPSPLPAVVSPKLFPFLYKMKDWGPQLNTLDYLNYQCHWCDDDSLAAITCPADLSREIGRLELGPGAVLGSFNGGWCADNTNDAALTRPPLLSDRVPGLPAELYVPDDQCAINNNPTNDWDLNEYTKGWKPGADRYCARTAPYDADCPKHGIPDGTPSDDPRRATVNPQCGQAGAGLATMWPDDMFDEIIYGSQTLFGIEAALQKQLDGPPLGIGSVGLTKTIEDWYPEVADWIEPPCPDPTDCPESRTKQERPGMLWIWRAQLQFINSRIQEWLKPSAGNEYVGAQFLGPNSVWCVPPLFGAVEQPSISAGEAATFDANRNNVRGDLYDVIQCLNWNANDIRTYPGPEPQAVGNAEKFERCSDCCTVSGRDCTQYCSSLPRSLVPAYYSGNHFNYTFSPVNSCDNATYRSVIAQSALEARNQVAKFRHRLKFLNQRYIEAISLSNGIKGGDITRIDNYKPDGVLYTAIAKLNEFLDGGTPFTNIDSPAETFINWLNNSTLTQVTGDLPAFGLYVWQDPDPTRLNLAGQPRHVHGRGYWHAVKVEVRLPRRCTGDCLEADWPKVVSSTTRSGGLFKKTKVCYRLVNHPGRTKARVIRYDQDKDLRGLVFPGGSPIWSSRMTNPSALVAPGDPDSLRDTCADQIDDDIRNWLNSESMTYRGQLGAAFMLNQVPIFDETLPRTAEQINYANCWTAVHNLLIQHGVQSEACAEYYYTGTSDGFRVRFVGCDNWF